MHERRFEEGIHIGFFYPVDPAESRCTEFSFFYISEDSEGVHLQHLGDLIWSEYAIHVVWIRVIYST